MADAGRSLDDAYDAYPRIEADFRAALDESLDPRGPEVLYELMGSLGLPPAAAVVDVGCGEGEHAVELARRFGFDVLGVDPVPRHLELARQASRTALRADPSLGQRLRFDPGTAEALPVTDASADLIWCRDALMYADVPEAFQEFHRVLRPGGHALVYQVCTGPRMTDEEARQFWSDLDAVSVRPEALETAAVRAGLRIDQCVDLSSEWGERAEERSGAGTRRLLHAARLLRAPDRYRGDFGESAYRIMLGDCLWHVYRMIGKLSARAYVCSRT